MRKADRRVERIEKLFGKIPLTTCFPSCSSWSSSYWSSPWSLIISMIMIIDNLHCTLFIFMFLLWQKCSPCQTGLLANHSTGNVLNYGMDIDTSAMQCLKVWILIHQICNVLKYGHWYFLCNVLKYGHPLPLHSKAHNLHLERWKPLQKNILSRRLVENTFSARET